VIPGLKNTCQTFQDEEPKPRIPIKDQSNGVPKEVGDTAIFTVHFLWWLSSQNHPKSVTQWRHQYKMWRISPRNPKNQENKKHKKWATDIVGLTKWQKPRENQKNNDPWRGAEEKHRGPRAQIIAIWGSSKCHSSVEIMVLNTCN
jgi:hypothetical protein